MGNVWGKVHARGTGGDDDSGRARVRVHVLARLSATAQPPCSASVLIYSNGQFAVLHIIILLYYKICLFILYFFSIIYKFISIYKNYTLFLIL